MKVLFVDDDRFLLDMYALKFIKNNFEVHATHSAGEALKVIEKGFEPDILLLDIVMPVVDGIEFLGHLRENNLVKDAVVIMLTNQGITDDIVRAKKLNVDGYIIKATTIPSEVMNEVQRIYYNARGAKSSAKANSKK